LEGSEPLPRVREYRLDLAVDFARLAFEGTVAIDLDEVTGPVVLNESGLEIRGAECNGRPLDWVVRADEEELKLLGVPPGRATVTVSFQGRASDTGLMGLYRSSFGSEYILTTQCAPTGARQVFPCLDRPDRKAPIRFEVTVAKELDVLFNTPPESERITGTLKHVTFAPTPPMATYLFYLGVGRFDAFHGPEGRVRISVFAPRGRAASGEFGVRHASELLPAFERYFGIPYPLPKLDLIAVPQYAYGAMENWGAIVFREEYLLVDDQTSTRIRRYALDTIAHEIAHQWFGNLVTMEWWTDIWLNESFATFLEMRIVDEVDPRYGSLDNYLARWMPAALEGDALPDTHPVTSEVTDPDEIAQVFDEISYGKGSAILRMIEAYLGADTFRRGVADFLKRFAHGNATSSDLWDAFDRAGREPVRPLLEAWTRRPGHPLLSVNLEHGAVFLRQRRFAIDGRHTDETWPIPLTYELNGAILKYRLEGPTARLPVGAVTSLHFNPGAAGFYRTLYDRAGYDLLLGDLSTRPAADQWMVLSDLEGFLYSGDVSFDLFERFLRASASSDVHLVVRVLSEALLGLWLVLGEHPTVSPAARSFLRHQFSRLTAHRRPGEAETDGVLRERVGAALAWIDPEVARTLADACADPTRIDPDLRLAATTAYARFGGASEHAELRRRLETAPSVGEAADYELALVSFRDPTLVSTSLDLLDRGTLNRAHLPAILRRAAWNPEGRDVAWEWITHHLEDLGKETRGTGFASYVYEYCLPYVGLTRADEVVEWIATHPVLEGERGAKKGLGLLTATRELRRRLT
jgi:tricorn protease interacting factor F2/3